MPMPRSQAAYRDVAAVLDTALRHGRWPVTFACDSPRAAHHWRHRANAFRGVLRRAEEVRLNLPRGLGTSIYDDLVFTLDEHKVVIRPRQATPGVLIIDGEPVEPVANLALDGAEEDDAFDL